MHNSQEEFTFFMRRDAAEYCTQQLTKSTAAAVGQRHGMQMVTTQLASRPAIMREMRSLWPPVLA